ncbi:MAG: NHLP family bacteriocin export ABC transporter peptidase/permease/ATPase subunit [Gammaproteobacteria bacterium]|nr:NHLP family bacteriocin export ABC transporter peptidase/permease/ATPase subunit [Gammaproteobacteria bacterium]
MSPVDFPPNLRGSGRRAVSSMLQMEATECSAACLGMVLAYHGLWVPLETLRVRCGVSRDGANAASMLRAARDCGLFAQGFRARREELFDLPFPMILFWNSNHFVVLEGIKRGRAYINDPSEGPCRVSLQEFDESFSGACFAFRPGPDFRPGGAPPSLLKGLRARFGRAAQPLVFAVLATLALVVPSLALPGLLMVFIDDVLIRQSGAWVGPLLIGLVGVAVCQGALVWIQRILLARMEAKLSVVTASGFFWHVASLPMQFFSQRSAGDIASRVTSNDTVANLMSGELAVNLVNLLTMTVYALAMVAYSAILTLISVVAVVLDVCVMKVSAGAREDANRRLRRERGRLAGASANGIRVIETLKANGAEGEFFARWSGIHASALIAQQRLGVVTVWTSVVPLLLTQLSTVAILGFGGLLVADGELTIGGLVAFQSLAASFAQPVQVLTRFGANLQAVEADIARLDDVLNYPSDRRALGGIDPGEPEIAAPAPRGTVELENVTFGYNVADPPLIEDISLSIQPGRRVALVGGSGSGKSTIARLVCGLLTPWSGSVRLDEQSIHDISPARFAEIVAHVDQEVSLFRGTVRENVASWDPSVEERDIVQALRDAAIHDLLASRPAKYDTLVDEDGRNFSGGQRQRLEIARALARNPAVLVLDEATAALDPVTELEIDDRLRQRGCTCLIIAHRLSTIRDADEIVVLDAGRIVQRGTHDQLLAEDGLYRTLVMTD